MRVNRQQLDRGDAQISQIVNRGLTGKSRVRAAELFRHDLVELRKTFDVQLINHRAVRRRFGRPVVAPRERFIDNAAQRRIRRTIQLAERQVLVLVADHITLQCVGPVRHACDGPRIRIQQHLVVVEAVPLLRLVGTVHAIAVELPWSPVGQVNVPHHVGVLRHDDPLGFLLVVGGIEKTKLHLAGVLAVQGKIHAAAIPRGTERIGATWPKTH